MTPNSANGPPPWSREETILAFWLAMQLQCERVTVDHTEVVELSALMRSSMPQAITNPRLRNPHGVARKIWAFSDRLEGQRACRFSPIAEAVWQDFAEAPPELLADAAAKARQSLLQAARCQPSTSRGPVPHSGLSMITRLDGPTDVYVALLNGTGGNERRLFAKIGLSNDTTRRTDQLNFGFPPPLGLSWSIVATWTFPTAMLAYRTEQAILGSEAAAGRSAGSEFLIIEAGGLDALLLRCGRLSGFTLAKQSVIAELADPSRATFCNSAACLAETPNSPPARL